MRSLIFCLGLWVLSLAAQETAHDWQESGVEPPSYSVWLERGRPDPPVGKPFELPAQSRGDLDIHDNLADFLAATAGLGELNHETFDENVLIAIQQGGDCFNPVDRRSDDSCFRPGDLIEGFQIRSSWGNFNLAWLVLLNPSVLGTPSAVVGPNAFNDPLPNPTRIDFRDGPTAVAMDVYEGIHGESVAITVFGIDDTVIGNFNVEPPAINQPAFAGVISPVPIGRIDLVGTVTGSGELIDNLRFGGGPGRLAFDPQAVAFGSVAVGDDAVAMVAVHNQGHLPLELDTVNPPAAPFALLTDTCSLATLNPGNGCELGFSFAPGAAVDAAAEIEILIAGDNAGQPLTINGRGVTPELVAIPAAIVFEADVGATSVETVEVANRAAVAATVAGLEGPGAPFQHTGGTCGPLPFELAPGQACTLEFTFNPPVAGKFLEAVSARSGADSEQLRIHLSGTATGD